MLHSPASLPAGNFATIYICATSYVFVPAIYLFQASHGALVFTDRIRMPTTLKDTSLLSKASLFSGAILIGESTNAHESA